METESKGPGLIPSDKPLTVWAPVDIDALTDEQRAGYYLVGTIYRLSIDADETPRRGKLVMRDDARAIMAYLRHCGVTFVERP